MLPYWFCRPAAGDEGTVIDLG